MTEIEWRLVPSTIEETRPFWEGCRRHELLLQRCRSCGSYQYYPRPFCGECHALELDWVRSSGRGAVYTSTVTYRNGSPEFSHRTPYVLAYVELEEGIRLMTNIIGCPPEQVRVGLPVAVCFEDVDDETSIPCFRPSV